MAMPIKWASEHEAREFLDNFFHPTARIVSGDCYDWVRGEDGREHWTQTYAGRPWFAREYNKHQFHPAVMDMMLEHLYKPKAWGLLLLEWPHRAESDPNRLAYTRDERSGEQNRQVLTSIGKYLTRHFEGVPDNVIRDIVAQYSYSGGITLTDDSQCMVDAVINGPRSCMSHSFDLLAVDGERLHPYAVYDPSLGWRMAIRKDNDGLVLGRCLVWHDDDADAGLDAPNGKLFVRSYKRERNEQAHSGTDEAIEAWLKSQGYIKRSAWPDGTPLMRIELRSGGWLMPYIDGNTQSVDEETFTIDCNGYISASNTGGTAEVGNCDCDDCGARFDDEDEGGWTGIYEDNHVCQSCLDNAYTYAYSRRGNQYYIRSDDVVYIDGEYYDINYLSDNDIVELANGEYEHMDNAIYIESADAYYHCDDDDICYAEDTGRHELVEDCWQCEASSKWYTDGTDYVEVDGDKYHPDNAPEQASE